MTKEIAACTWETLEVTKASDPSNPLLFEREAVSVESKRLYIGDSAKWSIKSKKITSIKLEGDDTKPSSVVLTVATDEITVRLIHVQNNLGWNKFLKRLRGFVRHSDVQLQMPSSSLSVKKTNFESGKVATARPDTSAFLKSTGNSRFSPSRLGRRQQMNSQFTSPTRMGRTRRTFGKKPRLTPTKSPLVEWSDDENDDLIVHPSPVRTPKKRSKSLYYSDDDQVQVQAEDEDKVMMDTDDEGEDETLFDNIPSGKTKRKVIDDSDNDCDDDQDMSVKCNPPAPLTTTTSTPRHTQNRVSPASRTQEKASESPSRQQQQLNKFFAPKTAVAVSSFDPTKRAERILSPVRLSTNSIKKSNHSNRSGGWLQDSKAGSVSPLRERQKLLFGSTVKETMTPKKDDDPVEEYPSPPGKRHPFDLLDQADHDPLQKKLDFRHYAITTGAAAHKRKRAYSNASTTPPRRLSLDMAASTKPDESALIPRNPWRGLRNLGNTCYLNSSIQMLVTLMSTTTGETTNWWDGLRGRGGPLTKSLINVVDQLMMPSPIGLSSVVNPSQVKNAIDAITDKFAGYEQRDAHEFLSDLIDSVHEELDHDSGVMAGKGASEAANDEVSPNPASPNAENEKKSVNKPLLPTDDFRLTVEVCLSCESCGYKRKKTEIYRHLSVDIISDNGKKMGSIANGLNHFFEPEVLEIRCEKCVQGSHAKRSLTILSRYVSC